jgi:cyclic pyranopterin phosphate synthase
MAAKKTNELVPLCHNIALSYVGVEIRVIDGGGDGGLEDSKGEGREREVHKWAGTGQGDAYRWHQEWNDKGEGKADFGKIEIAATVQCEGKTGVEMEALTAASVAGLTVYDMCKAVDKGMWIEGLRVVRKEGGKSGTWVEGVSVSGEHGEGGREGKRG